MERRRNVGSESGYVVLQGGHVSLEEYAGANRDVGAESGSGAATETRMAKVAASAVADQRQKDRSDRKQLRAPGELRIIVGGDLSVRSGGRRASAAVLHAASRTHIVATGFQNCVVCRLTGLACRRSLLKDVYPLLSK